MCMPSDLITMNNNMQKPFNYLRVRSLPMRSSLSDSSGEMAVTETSYNVSGFKFSKTKLFSTPFKIVLWKK